MKAHHYTLSAAQVICFGDGNRDPGRPRALDFTQHRARYLPQLPGLDPTHIHLQHYLLAGAV